MFIHFFLILHFCPVTYLLIKLFSSSSFSSPLPLLLSSSSSSSSPPPPLPLLLFLFLSSFLLPLPLLLLLFLSSSLLPLPLLLFLFLSSSLLPLPNPLPSSLDLSNLAPLRLQSFSYCTSVLLLLLHSSTDLKALQPLKSHVYVSAPPLPPLPPAHSVSFLSSFPLSLVLTDN